MTTQRNPGTRFTDARKDLPYSVEQTATLQEINDDRYALGIAKREYANQLLHADGSLSKDYDTVRSAIGRAGKVHEAKLAELKAKINKARNELTAAPKARRAALRAALNHHIQEQSHANAAANAAELLLDQFEEHLDEDRFLFVLSDDNLPLVYFQAAVPDNPDLPPLAGAKGTAAKKGTAKKAAKNSARKR